MNFLTVLAWILGPLATLLAALSLYGSFTYHGSIEQKVHAMRGIEARWPYGVPATVVAVVCWAWIIAGGWQ